MKTNKQIANRFDLADYCPFVGEITDAHLISDTHWQAIDIDGVILQVEDNGKGIPKRIVVHTPYRTRFPDAAGSHNIGLVRVVLREQTNEKGGDRESRDPSVCATVARLPRRRNDPRANR